MNWLQGMNGMSFSDDLAALGLSKRRLAKDLGLSYRGVLKWGDEPPGYAVAYMGVVRELRDLRDAAQPNAKPAAEVELRTVVGSDHAVSYGPRAGVAVPKAGVSRRVPPKGLTG